MSADTWVSIVMDAISLCVTSVLIWKVANKVTEVRLLNATPEEKPSKRLAPKGRRLTRRDEKIVFGVLLLMAGSQFYLSALDFYVVFTTTKPLTKGHLLMAVAATVGLGNVLILSVLLATGAWRSLIKPRVEGSGEA